MYRRDVRRLAMIVLAVALAGVWPVYRSLTNHSFTAIIGAGENGPSTALLVREVPDLVATNNAGHDGQQFYAVARAPFDPVKSEPYLDTPAYRYRRIMMPAMAWVLAPHGGVRLIATLMVLGLLGVALGALGLSLLPGAPWWLPAIVGVTPGVIASTGLTLGDSLALGFTLAAFAATMHRRPALAVAAVTLGTLTRETVVLAGLALALAPAVPRRWRAAYVVVPGGALLTWTLWESHALGRSITGGAADQFSLPLAGWTHATGTDLFIGLLLAIVFVVGVVRTREHLAVCAYLGLLLLLLSTLSEAVTVSWVNTTRAVVAGVPLAAWGIAREHA